MAIATEARVKFSREWAMPNSRTYDIVCIEKLIRNYIKPQMYSIDPFSNESRLATVTNDLNTDYKTDYHLEANDFLNLFESNSVDAVLFDPPYSLRQVSESYKKHGLSVNMETTQSSFWAKMKNKIGHIIKPNGIAICFGWNSSGIGTVFRV